MRDGYAWLTSNIMYQAPWDPVNFDRQAIKSDLNQIPEITVTDIEVVNRYKLAYWKEADVWFKVTSGDISESEIREKMLEKLTSPNRAREAVRKFKIGPSGSIPEGEIPAGMFNDQPIPWVAVGSTALTIATVLLVFDYIRG